jgi:ABC-type Zn2+ transport system substrate-binding protein/surface adhesin
MMMMMMMYDGDDDDDDGDDDNDDNGDHNDDDDDDDGDDGDRESDVVHDGGAYESIYMSNEYVDDAGNRLSLCEICEEDQTYVHMWSSFQNKIRCNH